MVKIKHVSDVWAGLPNFRVDDLGGVSQEDVLVVAGSAIGHRGEIIYSEIKRQNKKTDQDYAKHYLRDGDVILLSRGSSIRAALVTPKHKMNNLLAGSSVTIIRPDKEKLLGEILVIFFNSQLGQAVLSSVQQGTSLKSISLKCIKNIEIAIPSLDAQASIQKLFHANNEAYKDTISMAEQQNKAVTTVMLKMMSAV